MGRLTESIIIMVYAWSESDSKSVSVPMKFSWTTIIFNFMSYHICDISHTHMYSNHAVMNILF